MIREQYFAHIKDKSGASTAMIEKSGKFNTVSEREAWVKTTLDSAALNYRLIDTVVSLGEVTEQYNAERTWSFKPINGTSPANPGLAVVTSTLGSLEI